MAKAETVCACVHMYICASVCVYVCMRVCASVEPPGWQQAWGRTIIYNIASLQNYVLKSHPISKMPIFE